MKKETIITAVIFLAVGFLAGYITDAQLNWSARQKAAQAGASSEMPSPGSTAPAATSGDAAARPAGGPSSH